MAYSSIAEGGHGQCLIESAGFRLAGRARPPPPPLAAFPRPASAAEPANPHLTALVRGARGQGEQPRFAAYRDGSTSTSGSMAELPTRPSPPGSPIQATETLEADFGLALPAGSPSPAIRWTSTGSCWSRACSSTSGRRGRPIRRSSARSIDPGLGEVLRGYPVSNPGQPGLPDRCRTSGALRDAPRTRASAMSCRLPAERDRQARHHRGGLERSPASRSSSIRTARAPGPTERRICRLSYSAPAGAPSGQALVRLRNRARRAAARLPRPERRRVFRAFRRPRRRSGATQTAQRRRALGPLAYRAGTTL